MAENKKTWIYSTISPSLIKKDGIKEYNEKVSELKEEASTVAPEGNLIVFLFDKKSKYRFYEKSIVNLSILSKIYNERTFTRDPESAFEYAKIKEHLNAISKIIEKRKKLNKDGKRKNK